MDLILPTKSVLFHGTGEDFPEREIRGGGYDDVIWTAESATIAQNYIPVSGMTSYVDSDEVAHPSKNRVVREIQHRLGIEYDYSPGVVEWDYMDRAISYPLPAGRTEFLDRNAVEGMMLRAGFERYDYGRSMFKLRSFYDEDPVTGETHEQILMPGEKRLGCLFIFTTKEPLKILDLTFGGEREADLSSPDYHRLDIFEKARKAGYDGIKISDWTQSDYWGNFGHNSIGLFVGSLHKLSWDVIPATNFEWDETISSSETMTPEYLSYLSTKTARNPSPRWLPPEILQAIYDYIEHNWAIPTRIRRNLRYMLGKHPLIQEPKVKIVFRAGRKGGRSWTTSEKTAARYADEVGRTLRIQTRKVRPGEFMDMKPLYRALGLERHAHDREAYLLSATRNNPEEEYLYHGTSTVFADRIRQNGLPAGYWGTLEIAEYYAEVVVEEKGGNQIIFKAPMSAFDLSLLEPDHNSIAEPLTYTLGKSEDQVIEEWEACEGTWEDSLDIVESVLYRTAMPPENVSLEGQARPNPYGSSPSEYPKPIEISLPEGSLSGTIHNSREHLENWLNKRDADSVARSTLALISDENLFPLACLNNMWVDEESRGEGIGSSLMDMFFTVIEGDAVAAVLEVDTGQEQTEGFDLEGWYAAYGFARISDKSDYPLMLWSHQRRNPSEKQYSFLGPCDRLRRAGNEPKWQMMMRDRVPVSAEEFEETCQLETLLEDDETLFDFVAGDPDSGFFQSVWGDQPCMFIQTHGFEFVFTNSLMRGNPAQDLFMPNERLRKNISLWPEKGLEPSPDTLVVVQHKSTPKWLDLFMKEGVDATITPPDTNLGRLTVNKKTGGVTKSRISDAGLFVAPALGQEDAIIIVVPARDIGLSLEAEGLGYKTGLQGLYGAGDAILQRVIDPSEIAGRLTYSNGWTFIPNPKSLFADRFETNRNGSLNLV